MARMTPEREAAYALDWDLPRDDLDPAVQLEYDRLKMERESRPQMQAAAPRKTETPRWQYLIPLVILGLAWMSWAIWSIVGVSIIGSQMNFKSLRSDLSKVQLPAGYEKVSTSESGDGCARRPCTLTEFWAWHASRVHTAADACRDIAGLWEQGSRTSSPMLPTYRGGPHVSMSPPWENSSSPVSGNVKPRLLCG